MSDDKVDKSLIDRIAERQADEEAVGQLITRLIGEIPEWLPQGAVLAVKQILNRYQDPYYTTEPLPIESILSSMNTIKSDNMFIPGVVNDSVMYIQDMDQLDTIRTAIRKGEKEGMPFLMGTTSVVAISKLAISKQTSAAAKERKFTVGPVKHTLYRILTTTDACNLNKVLAYLEDKEIMADLMESRSDPIELIVQSVDHENRQVYFRKRNGEELKPIAFKTLQNYISEFSTSPKK